MSNFDDSNYVGTINYSDPMEYVPDLTYEKILVIKEKRNIITYKLYLFFMRTIDIILSSIGIIVGLPIFIIVSIAIKLDSPGKVFFVHKRIGKNGKEIGIYKFRTMVDGADNLMHTFTDVQKAEYEKNYKLDDDFRITKLGKFLRRTSIDELPQLVNVLFGDMALIGPRPVVEKELEKYCDNKDLLLSVKPGLTGYWQANGRSNTSYEERVQMDIYYVNNKSLLLDIQIIFKTIITVIKKEGAI